MTVKNQTTQELASPSPIWQELLTKYAADDTVRQLIFVQYIAASNAHLVMYEKSDCGWNELLSCHAFVGRNGLGKTREGDEKTPEGIFELPLAFGIQEDPGAKVPYVKVHKDLYWCGDQAHYNQLIDITEHPHDCQGEHLIDFGPAYHYGMFIDYNKEGIYGKGSAIFLHCYGIPDYTAGCVAVQEEVMKKILQHIEAGAKICIYPR